MLLLRHYCVYLHFIQSVTVKLTAMSAAKRPKSDARTFEKLYTADVFWFVCRNDKQYQYVHLYSTICCENVACRTSSISGTARVKKVGEQNDVTTL